MKLNAIWLLCILLFTLCAVAQEITALGFVEDKKTFDLDGDYIRLAFVRTNAGWGPSYFFTEDTSNVTLAESKKVTSRIMKKPWQIVDADGKYFKIGSLKNGIATFNMRLGLAAYKHPSNATMKIDSLGTKRGTWVNFLLPPLVAVPSGTQIDVIPPIATNDSIKAEVKDKLVKEYLKNKKTVSICDEKTGLQIQERDALPTDVIVKAQKSYQDGVSFYEVNLSSDSACDAEEDKNEFMAIKNNRVYSLQEPFTRRDWFGDGLTLFNRYVVSTKKTKDTVYVLYVSGYNLDGYALLDSELNIKAISTWSYH